MTNNLGKKTSVKFRAKFLLTNSNLPSVLTIIYGRLEGNLQVRWILHQRLEVFCIELNADGLECSCDFHEATVSSRIRFEVRFFRQDILPFRKM